MMRVVETRHQRSAVHGRDYHSWHRSGQECLSGSRGRYGGPGDRQQGGSALGVSGFPRQDAAEPGGHGGMREQSPLGELR
jgi:hypothetical protein